MTEFWNEYKELIFYVFAVIGIIFLLLLITRLVHRWLSKKAKSKYPNEEPATINLIKRVLNTLWVILGIAALSFIFIAEDKYEVAMRNIEIILYLGFVLVLTIVGASIVESLFSRQNQLPRQRR